MNKVYQIYGLHMFKFKNAAFRERYERGDTRYKPEYIYMPDAWFFCAQNQDVKTKFADNCKLFTEGLIIDPDINKNRDLYILDRYDRATPIGGL